MPHTLWEVSSLPQSPSGCATASVYHLSRVLWVRWLCTVIQVPPHQAPKRHRPAPEAPAVAPAVLAGFELRDSSFLIFCPIHQTSFPWQGSKYTNYFCRRVLQPLQLQGLDNCCSIYRARESDGGILKLLTQQHYEATANILSLAILFLFMSTSHSQYQNTAIKTTLNPVLSFLSSSQEIIKNPKQNKIPTKPNKKPHHYTHRMQSLIFNCPTLQLAMLLFFPAMHF